jgi:hypothetical protein
MTAGTLVGHAAAAASDHAPGGLPDRSTDHEFEKLVFAEPGRFRRGGVSLGDLHRPRDDFAYQRVQRRGEAVVAKALGPLLRRCLPLSGQDAIYQGLA